MARRRSREEIEYEAAMITVADAVMDAVAAGASRYHEIAEDTGLRLNVVWLTARYLEERGWIVNDPLGAGCVYALQPGLNSVRMRAKRGGAV